MQKEGQNVALRSQGEKITSATNVYVIDTLGELRYLYGITSIAVVGGSFLPGLAGHNISEAAAAGCAVLTGPYIGHFSSMVVKMQQFNPMSVLQVHGKFDLEEALRNLLKDDKVLEAHRMAAKHAQQTLASGIIVGTWNSLNSNVLRKCVWVDDIHTGKCRAEPEPEPEPEPGFLLFRSRSQR